MRSVPEFQTGTFWDALLPVKIHQINFAYLPVEDRLLFRFNTSYKAEFRLILTRAMSIRMLSQMESIVQINLEREYPAIVEDSRRAVGDFKREAAIEKSDYQTPYSPEAVTYPVGEQPLLVIGLTLGVAEGVPSMGFQLASNQTLSIALDHDLAQAINKLIRDNLANLDWGIGAPGAEAVGGETHKGVVH